MSKVLYPHRKPWCICHLEGVKTKVIRRYRNRQDADDDLRQLKRSVTDSDRYAVVFDVVEADETDKTDAKADEA